MNSRTQRLLIISRDALLDATRSETEEQSDQAELIFRSLANISRHGCHLLLTAAEPERWVPTRGTVDDALDSQNQLIDRTRSAGGEIDGVYYVPRSLLTQDRNRKGALEDILKRYSLESTAATLVSSSVPFIKAADRLGIRSLEIAPPGKRGKSLLSMLKRLEAPE